MIDFFFPTEGMGSQTLRTVAEAQYGGGDVFEIARVCRNLDPNDKDGFERAWIEKAEETEELARRAESAGHTRTAMKYFYSANQYWRMSDVLLTIERNDDKAERFKKSQECFQAGAKYNNPKIEVISVPCGDDVYE